MMRGHLGLFLRNPRNPSGNPACPNILGDPGRCDLRSFDSIEANLVPGVGVFNSIEANLVPGVMRPQCFITISQKHSLALLVSPACTSRQRQSRRPKLLFSISAKYLHERQQQQGKQRQQQEETAAGGKAATTTRRSNSSNNRRK